MTFQEAQKILGKKPSAESQGSFTAISTDSRTIEDPPYSLFVAMKGTLQDGHNFVKEVYEKGVRLFLLERPVALPEDAEIIMVESTLDALQELARNHRKKQEYPVVAITGSNGKTIVKEWLSTLLQSAFQVVKSPKSYNSQLGVPLSVWQMSSDHEIGVFEAGVSKEGEMYRLEQVIQPTIGVFTNIGEAHSEGFSSLEAKIKEKSQLFRHCEKVVYCKDQEEIESFLSKKYPEKLVSWSSTQKADISFAVENESCQITYGLTEIRLTLPVFEQPDLENLLHSLSVCLLMNMEKKVLESALHRIRPVGMRLSLKKGINSCYLIDDSYNNDLQGLKMALEVMTQQKQIANRTVILSDLLQTGYENSVLYPAVNKILAEKNINKIIGVGKNISLSSREFSMHGVFFESTEDLLTALPSFFNEMILIKGARDFKFERVVDRLSERQHNTTLTINFEHLLGNLKTYKKRLQPTTKVLVMVKAFAYGGGSFEIANFLQYHKIDYLGVAYFDEGVALRQNGITTPILVMNPSRASLSRLDAFDLEPEIYSLSILQDYIQTQSRQSIHLKIETGMNRLGFTLSEVDHLMALLKDNPGIRVASIFTHLASAENPSDDDFTIAQAQKFDQAYRHISDALGYPPLKHTVNSAGIIRWPQFHFDMVRLGIGLYGVDPTMETALMPAVTLNSTISQLKVLSAGETIGYSRSGKVERKSLIAIIPIGYADGFHRSFGNGQGKVLINGTLYPTIGNVCMDMTMVDVTSSEVREGDEVTLFGSNPTLQQVAKWANTIPYEILCSIGQRVKRIYNWGDY